MGTRPAEQVAQEIEDLRVDTDRVLTELESRFRGALNVRAQAERHPLATSSIGLALLGALGITAYSLYTRTTHKPKPGKRFREEIGSLRELVSERVSENGPRTGGRGDGVGKKVLWTFLTTILVTLASFAARRLSATLWSRTMHERPPTK